VGDRNCNIFPVGTIFFYNFNAFLRAAFKLHIQCPCNTHYARLLYNSDSYVAFGRKNILSCALMIRYCYYLPPLSQLQFLFTNKLSTSGTVFLCSDQKFINVSHEKIDIKIEIAIFFKNLIKIDGNLKTQNHDHTSVQRLFFILISSKICSFSWDYETCWYVSCSASLFYIIVW